MSTTKTKAKGAVAAPAVETPVSDEQASTWIENIGAWMRRLSTLQTAMQAEIAAVKARHEQAAQPTQTAVNNLVAGIRLYCERERARLCPKGEKTIALPGGEVAWRTAPPSVRITNVERVIAAIKALKLGKLFLRQKEEINREAMLAAPEQARTIAGVSIGSAGESFYVKPVGLDVELDGGRL